MAGRNAWALAIGLGMAARACGAGGADGPFGPNILPGGGMEEWRDKIPAGWTIKGNCAADETEAARGKRSARLELTGKGAAELVSGPVKAAPGWYFLRYVFKQDVPAANEGAYARESYATVDCLDGSGGIIGSTYVFGSEHAIAPWTYRHRIFRAPPGASALRVNLCFVNHVGEDKACALWIDEVELCTYRPPDVAAPRVVRTFLTDLGRYALTVDSQTPARVFEGGLAYAEFSSPMAEPDPRSASGLVRHWPAGRKSEMFWNSPSFSGLPPGVYRLSLRVRAAGTDDKDPNRPAIQAVATYPHINAIGHFQVPARDLRRDGQYHDYWADFVKPDWGALSLRIDPGQEAPEFWLDYVVVRQVRPLDDADSRFVFPAMFETQPPPAGFPCAGGSHALLLQGLSAESYRIGGALELAGITDVKRLFYKVTYEGGPAIEGMPEEWAGLCRCDLVIAANANLRALSPATRFRLREWVRAGGGLVLLGGKMAYGASGLKGSFLDEALPVETSDSPFDILACDSPVKLHEHAIARGMAMDESLSCPFVHDVRVRAGADVIASAGNRPVLVVGRFGRGRVACLTAPPYGVAAGGRRLLWESERWGELVRRVVAWSLER